MIIKYGSNKKNIMGQKKDCFCEVKQNPGLG